MTLPLSSCVHLHLKKSLSNIGCFGDSISWLNDLSYISISFAVWLCLFRSTAYRIPCRIATACKLFNSCGILVKFKRRSAHSPKTSKASNLRSKRRKTPTCMFYYVWGINPLERKFGALEGKPARGCRALFAESPRLTVNDVPQALHWYKSYSFLPNFWTPRR